MMCLKGDAFIEGSETIQPPTLPVKNLQGANRVVKTTPNHMKILDKSVLGVRIPKNFSFSPEDSPFISVEPMAMR